MDQGTIPASQTIPGNAPVMVWVLVIAGAVLWWSLPWLQRLSARASAPVAAKPLQQGVGPAHASAPGQVAGPSVGQASSSSSSSSSGLPTQPLGLGGLDPEQQEVAPTSKNAGEDSESTSFDSFDGDVAGEFAATFAEAARLVGDALRDAAPQSAEYSAATAALQRASEVLDRIFQKWGSEEELQKVTRLREASESFRSSFGEHCASSKAAKALLQLAGFQKIESEGLWVFPWTEARARLQALTVRLCLQKHAELQRLRGKEVWTQSSNEGVMPQPGSAMVQELFVLYRTPSQASPPTNSYRERNTEVAVRAKVHERRAEAGLTMPLALHEGLAQIARALAAAQSTRSRKGGSSEGPSGAEVRALVRKLPMPPGFDVQVLFAADELPHVFGLASSTGASTGATKDVELDRAAEIIAAEGVASWTRQPALTALTWSGAAVYGVGACLDYTANRGFLVTLLLGFDALPPSQALAAAKQERQQLTQRKAELPKPQGGAPFGNQRVQTISSFRDPPSDSRRRRGGG